MSAPLVSQALNGEEHVQFGDLRIAISEPAGLLHVDWRGKSNDRNPDVALKPFLADLTRRASEHKALVDMHFERLDFFNSATTTVLIQFVKDARAKQIRLQLSYSAQQRWQKIFFDALAIFEKPDGLLKIRALA